MLIRLLLLMTAAVVLAASGPVQPPVVAQDTDGVITNPDLYLPRDRREQEVIYKVRQARQSEHQAVRLAREGKEEESFDKWRDAFGRYQELRNEYLRPDMPANAELLVRTRYYDEIANKRELDVYTETWVPLADYLNGRMRVAGWPDSLKNRLALQLEGPGEDMLKRALRQGDEALLRRCARFYQLSDAGRKALKILAAQALERADSVSAIRWLEDYMGSWPDEFNRDAAMHVLYFRACRDAGHIYRMGRTLSRLERSGFSQEIDIGGETVDSLEAIRRIASASSPQARPELKRPGWRTLQGAGSRNGIAPPVTRIGELVDLNPADEEVYGRELMDKLPGEGQDSRRHTGQDDPATPTVFPVNHESGFYVHRAGDRTQSRRDALMWFRHGREGYPVTLEVPKDKAYTPKQQDGSSGWYYGGNAENRDTYRVMSSSIGRLRWELDNREADVLFAVMGPGSPTRNKGNDPTGTQIQGFDLSRDAALRVTIPNRKVEGSEDWDFLKHMVFSGTPLIRGNRLYIAGAITSKDTYEVWMCCFDVTPKGEPSEGEGKLVWRTQICSRKLEGNAWGRYGNEPVTLPEISSVSEQGGLLYVSTHSGCSAAVDRATGELSWLSIYGRQNVPVQGGWFNNPPVAAAGFVITAPYDGNLSLILDAVTGEHWMEYPILGKGALGEYRHILGVVENRLVIQGRSGIYSVALTSFRDDGSMAADWGSLHFQADYPPGEEPSGRGVIAGESLLVPFAGHIAIYDVNTGKLRTRHALDGVKNEGIETTLTVYCRGESYEDDQGLTRCKPVTLTDPKTGNVFNVEHLRNGETFTFPSGESAIVKKETFVILASAKWVHVFRADDGGEKPESPEE